MKLTLLFLAMAVIALTVFAQPQAPQLMWRQTHADQTDYLETTVRQTPDGGFIVAGSTADFSMAIPVNSYLWKMDSLGATTWFKSIGSRDQWEQSAVMCLTLDNGYLLAGSRVDQQADDQADALVLRTNAAGDSLWQRCYNLGSGDEIHSVEPADDGGYLLAGSADFGTDQVTNMTVLKIGADGDSLWSRHFVNGRMADGSSVKPTSDGGCILVGTNRTGSGYVGHAYVVKLDAQGAVEWERTYGQSSQQTTITDVVVTPDGGYALTGFAYISAARNSDAIVLRLAANGDSLWMHYYGATGRFVDSPNTIVQTADGGFVLGGTGQLLDANNATLWAMCQLIGVNSTGEQQWMVTADSARNGSTTSLCPTRDGGFVMSGLDFVAQNGRLRVNRFRAAPTSAVTVSHTIPTTSTLHQNFPNPFNPETEIGIELRQSGHVVLSVYDLLGREVARCVDGFLPAGYHTVTFDGHSLSSGVYYCQLQTAGMTQTRKMLLVK